MDRARLDSRVRAAIETFEQSPVGRQLADPTEREGRCGRASQRFIAALRHEGVDDARLLEWAWGDHRGGEWHHAVLLSNDIVIDWTASQFKKTWTTLPRFRSRRFGPCRRPRTT
jgi:hypothetical protein